MKRVNEGGRTTPLSLTESVRVKISAIVNLRIEPKARARIEVRLFDIGRLQEFVFQLIDHVPSRD